MSFDIQLKNIMQQINNFKASADNSLPQNTFYLNENQILCRERDYGVSRFAYDANGLVVWARSSGHIDAYESTFTIFRELNNFEDASIAFMGGLKQENGEYFPVSLFECMSLVLHSSSCLPSKFQQGFSRSCQRCLAPCG